MELNQLLVERFEISVLDIEKALSYQQKFGGRIEQILINMGSLPEDQLVELYSVYLELPVLTAEQIEAFDRVDSSAFPELEICLEHGWIPLSAESKVWTFVVSDPLNPVMNEWLFSRNIQPNLILASTSDINLLASKFGAAQEIDNELYSAEEEKLKELATEAPVVNLLNSLISKALRQGASDMHLEPYGGRYRARFRVDGVLHEADTIPANKQLPIVTRLKILSGMDIAERRRPQDGKIEMKIANQEVDIRVSALPLNDGESIVMRFLRKESVRYEMSVLGLSQDIEQRIREDIKKTAGVVLLTGPTGSGKTTTLYTFLNALNNDDVKIITLEDPVEYQLEGINQVQVNSEIGFDFAAGLRSIVRQDPDVIMLGEIRDKETAQIALQSALTGHLVFSTVHTNDAASAYTRLLDLGVEEFLLNAALISVVAQRLARKVCDGCSVAHPDNERLIKQYELESIAAKFGLASINLRHGTGCEKCGNTGYKGRLAVTEYLACDDTIKSIPKDADFIQKAKSHNASRMRRTLFEDGLYKAILGQTTIEEVVRVAG
ncbi:GspE/PulE family protein [Pseudoalteromonas sp. S16_S37]|uniref:GspE/PulE family protein n=1 Tax=Pseudoalteromonas sp. S16_S37 TaxID=2720228 RepID=UPI0016802D28|nr:GspE/PulE family protein [Pseudoalteromonas sp. S16_S37]MBD1580980.1 type II/IV secretion system protein [Pseudoalteromonas sp. S16_S37]